MSGPFKMKGHSLPGPNQASPAKAKPPMTDEQKQKARYVELSKENEDKPGFKEARDKAFGGKTTVKGGVSTTRTTVKESPAQMKGPDKLKKKKVIEPNPKKITTDKEKSKKQHRPGTPSNSRELMEEMSKNI